MNVSVVVQTRKRSQEPKTHFCANGDITNLLTLFAKKSHTQSNCMPAVN